MEGKTITITRHQLYKRVWQTPIVQLAKEYSLSDVGLAKICKKYDIPRPPRGYWAKKAAGIEVKKIPLPNSSRNEEITIRPNLYDNKRFEENHSIQQYLPENDIGPVILAKRLASPHPLVEQAAAVLNQSEPNENGLLEAKSNQCLNIKVSSKVFPRALRIMDALIKTLNDLQFDVYITKGNTVVNIDDIELEFGIREELKTEQKRSDPTLDGYYRFNHSRYHQVKVPSGNLCLSVLDFYTGDNLQKNWRDTKRKQLEDELEKFIKGLIKIAVSEKEKVRQREERERQRQEMIKRREEEKRRREELQRKINEEQNRVEALVGCAENWRKSKLLREFIAAVEKSLSRGECHYIPDCEWEEWFKWAKDQADRLDPLTPSPPSIIDEDIESLNAETEYGRDPFSFL